MGLFLELWMGTSWLNHGKQTLLSWIYNYKNPCTVYFPTFTINMNLNTTVPWILWVKRIQDIRTVAGYKGIMGSYSVWMKLTRNLGVEFQIACSLCRFTPFPRKPTRKIWKRMEKMLKHLGDWFIFGLPKIHLFANSSIKFLCNFNPQNIIQDGIRIGTHRLRIISFACLKNQGRLSGWPPSEPDILDNPEQVHKSQNSDAFLIPWQIHVWHIYL